MSSNLSIENVLIQVRSRLQGEGIKLWLPPYHIDGIGSIESELENLTSNMCRTLSLPHDYCLAAINELQHNALDILKARGEFSSSGIATLKVRVPNTQSGVRLLTIQTRLDVEAENLHQQIGKELGLASSRVKLIGGGVVLQRNQTLESQNIQNNQKILAVPIEVTSAEASLEDAMFDKLQRVKEDVQTLLNRDNSFMEMEDQSGNVVHLPPEEKRALMMALAMHEKGRAALKREDWNEALIFLLEGDHEFKTCNSRLLETVDNYALLNLDIVWCYFMLHSVSHLPDAESRLKICENNFKKSYGENLDRVVSLKGNAVSERALIMRLHLMQAVFEFHKNNRNDAHRLLMQAQLELEQLKVDENSVKTLVEMGFTTTESRIGLRACTNNIDQALTFIEDRRKQRVTARKIGAAQRKVNSSLLTKSTDKWINPKNLHLLAEMGFDRNLSAIALRRTNNDIDQSILLLHSNQDELRQELAKEIVPDKSVREQMLSMGFPIEIIDIVLSRTANDIETAMDQLLQIQANGGFDEIQRSVASSLQAVAGCSSSSLSSLLPPSRPSTAKEKEAFKRFAEDVDNDDDDYLDLPLVQEQKIIGEYMKLYDL